MSSLSPRIGLSYVMPAQAQKHVTVNESLRRLDALVHCAVQSATLIAQPATPGEGDAYILPPGRTGAVWATIPVGQIATFQDGAWATIAPIPGLLAYVEDTAKLMLHNGSVWLELPLSAHDVPMFGVNTTASSSNRLAVKSDGELLSHDDVTPGSGDARKIINKATAAKTASLVFQTGFSGRGEFGLMGDDNVALKVSSNGSAWTTAVFVDKANGNVAVRRSAAASTLHLGGPSDPALRIQEDGSAGYGELVNAGANQTILRHIAPAATEALIDLSPQPSDGTSQGRFRFFRETNTTASCSIDIHAGNNTSTINHSLRGKGHSFLQADSGNLRVGSATAAVCTLDVAGPVRVASYTVATLPSASAGAGQIIYVSNAAGGAILAFSDGSAWRRSDDRTVVA